MKTLIIVSLLCLGIFLVMGYSVAYAVGEDSDTETSAVSLTIPHAAKLVISDADSSLTLAQDGTAETAFEAGYTDMPADYPKLKVSANNGWQLSAQVTAPFAAVGTYTKAVGDLELKHDNAYVQNGFGGFTALSTTDQVISSNGVGDKNEWHNCQYRILLDYENDVPGTYNATVTYTLATQS